MNNIRGLNKGGKQLILVVNSILTHFTLILLVLTLTSCQVEKEDINFGKDDCEHCRMRIVDTRFGAEIVTTKGKVFKFDDVNCMVRYIKDNKVDEKTLAFTLVVDYGNPKQLIDAKTARYLRSDDIQSPMGSHLAAFVTDKLDMYIQKWKAEKWDWQKVYQKFN